MALNLPDVGGGGGNGVTVDIEQGLSTTDSISEIVEEMGKALKRLNGDVEAARNAWTGRASVKFHEAADAWQQEGAQLQTALDGLQAALKTGFTNYDSEDDAIGDAVAKVMGGSSPIGTHTNL